MALDITAGARALVQALPSDAERVGPAGVREGDDLDQFVFTPVREDVAGHLTGVVTFAATFPVAEDTPQNLRQRLSATRLAHVASGNDTFVLAQQESRPNTILLFRRDGDTSVFLGRAPRDQLDAATPRA